MAEAARIAEELMSVLGSGRQITPFSKRVPGFGLPMAYDTADHVVSRRRARGEVTVGRKIGFTNHAIWDDHGITAPIWGHVYDTTLRRAGAETLEERLRGWPEPRIEPELVLHLKAAPEPGMDLSELLSCIDWVAPGLEIVFSVYPGWAFTAADAAAAFGVHRALIVGVPLAAGPDLLDPLERFGVVLECDDGQRREGRAENVLGGPLHALSFLVAELADRPGAEPLRAGEVVTTGTLTEAMAITPGETWRAHFAGIDLSPIALRTV